MVQKKTIYECSDGQTFTREEMAWKHEKLIVKRKRLESLFKPIYEHEAYDIASIILENKDKIIDILDK